MKTHIIQTTEAEGHHRMPAPSHISVAKDRHTLTILWDDGCEDRFESAVLRAHCQSAPSKRAMLDGADNEQRSQGNDQLSIAEIRPVGQYGINIVFSDGHDRGIYPWSLLQEISATQAGD